MEERRYFGCFLKQREDGDTTPLFIFIARVKDLKEWSGTRRSAEVPQGTQRLLKPTRVNAIKRFLQSNTVNTIPNSVLIAFEPNKATFTALKDECLSAPDFYNNCQDKLTWGFLNFSFESGVSEYLRPALIVDGQHRIDGISSFTDENLPILIACLVNANHQEQAFQFIVVNDKAIRVPTENVKFIIADFNEADLQERLLKAGIRYGAESPKLRDINDLPESPFYHLLDWSYNRGGEKVVQLTTIEQGLKFLNAHFGNVIGDDEGSEVEIFCAIWRGVKKRYSEFWGKKDNKFMTKVSLNAMNELMIRRLKTLWSLDLLDVFNLEQLETRVFEFWKPVPELYWQSDWSVAPQDTVGFRGVIQSDLELMLENVRLNKLWYKGLQLPQVVDKII